MCNLLEISRSGYYAYFSESRKQKRNNKNLKDEELIASTFADLNNKINSLYAEIAELKE